MGDRCVICQMEYRRGNLQMTLPCKHVYHASCVTRWLSINKVSNQILERRLLSVSFLCFFCLMKVHSFRRCVLFALLKFLATNLRGNESSVMRPLWSCCALKLIAAPNGRMISAWRQLIVPSLELCISTMLPNIGYYQMYLVFVSAFCNVIKSGGKRYRYICFVGGGT